MRTLIGRHLTTILVAMATAAVTAGGPALAAAVAEAVNADTVDGKHAVGAGASVSKREGKLVATSETTGRLPNNIIRKAPDAQQLDGIDSDGFLRKNGKAADSQLLDGFNSTDFERRLQRTKIVRRVGTPAQNGAAMLAALDAIPSSGDRAPTQASPWLILIEPGTYDLGDTALVMRQWIDIHGAGMGITTIRCTCGGTVAPESAAAVYGANNATLQDLTVLTNTQGAGYDYATAFAADGVSARLSRVHLQAFGDDKAAGFVQTGASATSHLTGVVVNTMATSLNDTGVLATGGGTVDIFSSRVLSPLWSVDTDTSGASVRLANSQLAGSAGGATCVASFDTDFQPLSPTCQPTSP